MAAHQDGWVPPSPPAAKMATYEKRRAAAATPTAAASSGLGDEEEFLLQADVTAMVREALLKVLEARPEEPVSFLADYFERLVLGSSGAAAEAAAELSGPMQRLSRALWYVRLAHHSHRCGPEATGSGRRTTGPGVPRGSGALLVSCRARGVRWEL